MPINAMSSQHRCTVYNLSKYFLFLYEDLSLKNVMHSQYVKIYNNNFQFYCLVS